MAWTNDIPERFSAKVRRLLDPAFSGSSLELHEILGVVGRPTLLLIMLVLSLAIIALDFFPGFSFILGLPLLWLAVQFAIGRTTPWLPGFLKHKSIQSARVAPLFSRSASLFEGLEGVAHPRYTMFAEKPYAFLTAFLMVVLSVVIVLPIPYGDVVPAIAIAFLALGQLEFDGALIAIGQMIGLMALGALAVVITLMIGGFDVANHIIVG